MTSIQTISELRPIVRQLSEDLGKLSSKLFGITHIDAAYGVGTDALSASSASMRSAAATEVREAFAKADPKTLIARLSEAGKGADAVNLYRHDLDIYANGLRDAAASDAKPSTIRQSVESAHDGVEMLLHRINY
jgi:hypothetical protein